MYYLCAYGESIRWSKKCSSVDEATQDTYGLKGRLADRITTVEVGTRSPKYLNRTTRLELFRKLKEAHKTKTGTTLNIGV